MIRAYSREGSPDAADRKLLVLQSIKQLLPRSKGGAARFEKFAVDEIPQNASAGGARPGVCNTLASCMPAELAVHTTGHDMRSQSSLWEYVDVSHAIAQVGATVLAQTLSMGYIKNWTKANLAQRA